MAGQYTSVLEDALSSLKMKKGEAAMPGAGTPFEVTDETLAMLKEVKDGGKKIVVTDGGSLEVQ